MITTLMMHHIHPLITQFMTKLELNNNQLSSQPVILYGDKIYLPSKMNGAYTFQVIKY